MKKFKTKKNLGQHFLINESIIKKIVSIKSLNNCDVIEIGPGFGSLSKEILNAKPRSLTAIEKDIDLKPYLDKIKQKNKDIFSVLYNDAKKLKLSEMLRDRDLVLIANLPYNIATTLIINWLQYIYAFTMITVMVQKEVADRLTASPSSKSFGRISVLIQLLCYVEKKFDLGPENFSPPPKVSSSIISIVPKNQVKFNYQKLDLLLKRSFIHRRKKVINNLKSYYPNIVEIFKKCKLNLDLRAQDISQNNFLKISKLISI